ncbi:MAG: hypothetical protein JKY95_14000 [Planctomycetaceae bacterium]|nr:hypothetical protein [Planctomycetaceae bacterium]
MKRIGLIIVVGLVLGSSHFVEAQELSKHDILRVAVQRICPVEGTKLGEHGKPIKVKAGKEEIFLCCQACMKGKIDPKHWATIHANAIKAQGICPIMENDLPANPKSTIINGQVIYVCCPPCTAKIEANPPKYLAIIDSYYKKNLKRK